MSLEPEVVTTRQWSESSDNISCTLTVATSGVDDKGKPYTSKRDYSELTVDALFKMQLQNYKKGLVKVINYQNQNRVAYGWQLESDCKKDSAFHFIGFEQRFGESLPVYRYI